jgi:hypothetical protein
MTMATKYISRKTSQLYESSTGGKRNMVLIFGDEVETSGPPVDGRVKAQFRGRKGFLSEDHLGDSPVLELYFIDVGQGDSTFIVTPNRKKILIDGGVGNRAYGFLAWKYNLEGSGAPIDIDLLVLSHADGDHILGLIPIIKHPKINVKHVIHNGIATFKKEAFDTIIGKLDSSGGYLTTCHDTIGDLDGLPLDDQFKSWRDSILEEGTLYDAADSTMGQIDVGDPSVSIDIIGPRLDTQRGKPVYRWLKGEAPTINGHSVVLRLTYGNVSAIFPGDINAEGSKNLFDNPNLISKFDAHVFKAPHHGSHDFHKPFLEAVNPQISTISSGDEPSHGHPRAVFVGAVGRASRSSEPLIFSTKIAATFVEEQEKETEPAEGEDRLELLDSTQPNADAIARRGFKKVLNGMINVRTDGNELYAARRVTASYKWESYGPITPAPRS